MKELKAPNGSDSIRGGGGDTHTHTHPSLTRLSGFSLGGHAGMEHELGNAKPGAGVIKAHVPGLWCSYWI